MNFRKLTYTKNYRLFKGAYAKLNILVIEDEALARKVLAEHLAGHNLDTAGSAEAAKKKLAQNRYDICFIYLNPKIAWISA